MDNKACRPVRNRRHSRRVWPPGDINRPIKRLFTPEIKKMLKDWLVRRRDNPYPSRDEKQSLAIKTGLTYTQICNWFANWRRKLKNAGKEPQKKTWGHLIKNYNTSARGNVEQFSICSNDSIWGDEERNQAVIINYQQQQHHHHQHQHQHQHHHQHHHQQQQQQHQQAPVPPLTHNIEHVVSNLDYYSTSNHQHQHHSPNNYYHQHNLHQQHNNNSFQHENFEFNPRYGNDCQSQIIRDEDFNYKLQKCDDQFNKLTTASTMPLSTVSPTLSSTSSSSSITSPSSGLIGDHPYAPNKKPSPVISFNISQEQCFQISSTTNNINNNNDISCAKLTINDTDVVSDKQQSAIQHGYFTNPKYKNHIMEKYLRGLDHSTSSNASNASNSNNDDNNNNNMDNGEPKPELSKWLQSTANFTPNKYNYIEWDTVRNKSSRTRNKNCNEIIDMNLLHQKEELDAAEALTSLAGNYRNRMIHNSYMNNTMINNNNNN